MIQCRGMYCTVCNVKLISPYPSLLLSSLRPHPEEDEGEEDRSLQPAETAGWEDAIAVMVRVCTGFLHVTLHAFRVLCNLLFMCVCSYMQARGAPTVPELPAESSLRSCVSTASMKVKNVKK